jgi:hypothetical protein
MEFHKKYCITLPLYELKYFEEKNWHAVSEKAALEDLLDNFAHITPIIIEMLHGKEITTQYGVYRIKNHRELNRVHQYFPSDDKGTFLPL